MSQTMAMLLAGGQGSRLLTLSQRRAKPAVPFGGIFRIIDFTLSCIMRSSVPVVGVLTQYRPYSLMDHISMGEAWGFVGRRRLAKVLPPYVAEDDSDWYAGTADAVYQNLDFIHRFPDFGTILVLSGDHIYNMDYRQIVEQHLDRNADLTIACQEVPWDQTRHFGIMVTDGRDRIIDFQEKPKDSPRSNLASLGIYVFRREALIEQLRQDNHDARSTHDFGNDIIPKMIAEGRAHAWKFDRYWRDVGTIDAYWRAHMDIIDPAAELDLVKWDVHTNPHCFGDQNLLPARIDPGGGVVNSSIALGCRIAGHCRHSVLSPGVVIGAGAVVENCVILHETVIEAGARLRDTIIDKNCHIGEGAVIGEGEDRPSQRHPDKLSTGLTLIGKSARVPEGASIGGNCLIDDGADIGDFPGSGLVESGGCVRPAPFPDAAARVAGP